MTVTVHLYEWERDNARYVGSKRAKANAGKGCAAHYNQAKLMDSTDGDERACCGEIAVAKHLNCYWAGGAWPNNQHSQYSHLPDVYPNYEVRTVTSPSNCLQIHKSDVAKGRVMVLTYPHPDNLSKVDIIGQIDAASAWEVAITLPFQPDPNTKYVKQHHLEPVGGSHT